jgi:cellulose synthase/poly-beta-1,6-N-acetylglucosamine synthase-like glycosyltransferase
MLLSAFLVCVVALATATVLLLATGVRVGVAAPLVGGVIAALVSAFAGVVATRLWNVSPASIWNAGAVLSASALVISIARPRWNPVAQAFAGIAIGSSLVYLAFGTIVTFASGLSAIASVASGLLLILEAAALTLSASFAFESFDVLCTPHPVERPFGLDPTYRPIVSLQVAAYNEPPDMLIETIKSLEAIDYPTFEVVVIDNNTKDPAVWQPVADYCEGRDRVRFVHVDDWPGYKSGALNLVLAEYTHPDAELVGVIDADYLVDPSYLSSVVGYFHDPELAFLQTPQDYRDYENDGYLTACYDAYRYFFLTTMPARNQRNSIIFAGTMGLLRRNVLEKVGGWNEWCVTEDAEASLRILREGYAGLYIGRSFGRGIMPLTFASLKGQRFRWCFGGMQLLRLHWRDLDPFRRDPENHLTVPQRLDYLVGGLQWLNDLLHLGFALVLLAMAAVILINGSVPLRPLVGASILLPMTLLASGLLRALWSLRLRARISTRRAILAAAGWLSLSWTVAYASIQGLFRKEGAFLRTPKVEDRKGVVTAVWTARTESVIALALWGAGAAVAVSGLGNPLLVALFAWQGAVYASSPYMAWLNQHTELTAQLERRRRSEWMRDRVGRAAPLVAVGTMLAGVAVAAVLIYGGSHPGPNATNPFDIRQATGATASVPPVVAPVIPSTSATVAPVTPSPTASTSVTPSVTPSTSPTVLPSSSIPPTTSSPPSSTTPPTSSPAATAAP